MMFVGVRRFVTVTLLPLLLPENFSRQILFTVGEHIYLDGRNHASFDARNLQPCTYIESCHGVF